MLVDSHCHLDRINLDAYDGDLQKAIEAACDCGVQRLLCVGISLENIETVIDIANQYGPVYASAGIHPLDVQSGIATKADLFRWASYPKVVAFGETGLDYHYSEESRSLQQESFIIHLEAAKELNFPVIVHTREAKTDTLTLIKQNGGEAGGVLHCFTEDWDMASKAIDMNYFISISGIVTFRNASLLRDVVKKIPLEHLLVETDSPYLAPVPYRGKSNEPKYVKEVAEYIAELKGISYSKLIEQTGNNFMRLFSKVCA